MFQKAQMRFRNENVMIFLPENVYCYKAILEHSFQLNFGKLLKDEDSAFFIKVEYFNY